MNLNAYSFRVLRVVVPDDLVAELLQVVDLRAGSIEARKRHT